MEASRTIRVLHETISARPHDITDNDSARGTKLLRRAGQWGVGGTGAEEELSKGGGNTKKNGPAQGSCPSGLEN